MCESIFYNFKRTYFFLISNFPYFLAIFFFSHSTHLFLRYTINHIINVLTCFHIQDQHIFSLLILRLRLTLLISLLFLTSFFFFFAMSEAVATVPALQIIADNNPYIRSIYIYKYRGN
jgi:hypothetical protein